MNTRATTKRIILKLERKYIPNIYKKKSYIRFKNIILIPLALLTYYIDKLSLHSHIRRPKRKKQSISAKFGHIVSGFANLSFPNKNVEEVAMKRAEICGECPSAVKTGVYSIVRDSRTQKIQGMMCDECGCNLSAKVRSVSDSCPLGKW